MRIRMFQPRFAELVKAGIKRQTIRPVPRRPCDMPKAGDAEIWRQWSGRPYHSPQIELVKVILTSVEAIKIFPKGRKSMAFIEISKICFVMDRWDDFAKRDGFANIAELFDWFEKTHGLPFTGILIKAK